MIRSWTAAVSAGLCRDGIDQMLGDAEDALAGLEEQAARVRAELEPRVEVVAGG